MRSNNISFTFDGTKRILYIKLHKILPLLVLNPGINQKILYFSKLNWIFFSGQILVSEIVINEIKCWHCLLMHFHALASFEQGVNINSVHRPCHMLELPRGNPLHTFSYPLCYQPTLFELPTSAINQVLLIASFSYHQLLLTFPSGWCAYFLALLSIFANAGILEHKGSPNGTNLELTQDHVLQARMLWIFNRRDRCCKKSVLCLFCPFSFFLSFFVFFSFFVFLYWSGKMSVQIS